MAGGVTCFSGVGQHAGPAARDVDVEDVYRGHGETGVAQLAVPAGHTHTHTHTHT